MKTKTNFCGIFATTFMVATAITIASCSQDDDDYNSNMYTLAEKMETRSGGDPGGGTGGEALKILAGADTFYCRTFFPVILEEVISWPEGYFGLGTPEPTPTLKVNFLDDLDTDFIQHKRYEILSTQAYWFGGLSVKGSIRVRIKNSDYYDFIIGDTIIEVMEAVNIETESIE